ncbi:hypothetical protein ACJZ2D_001827 [Fusarium nematophilum]
MCLTIPLEHLHDAVNQSRPVRHVISNGAVVYVSRFLATFTALVMFAHAIPAVACARNLDMPRAEMGVHGVEFLFALDKPVLQRKDGSRMQPVKPSDGEGILVCCHEGREGIVT